MKSFTTKLVLGCTGVIFTSFLVVYILFNVLVAGYIRAEAEREFAAVTGDVTTIAFTHYLTHSGRVLHNSDEMTGAELHILPGAAGRFEVQFDLAADLVVPELGEWIGFGGQFDTEDMSTDDIRTALEEMGIFYIAVGEDAAVEGQMAIMRPDDSWRVGEEFVGVRLVEGQSRISLPMMDFETMMTFRPARRSVINVDTVVLSYTGEILTPSQVHTNPEQWAEIEFVSGFFIANQDRFADDAMVMATAANSSYYIRAMAQARAPESVSVLLFSDTSAATEFTNSMNRILGVLLAVSGLLSLGISITMSVRFKRAIGRLCSHAATIGQGNFTETAGVFKDTEFNRLSQSMDSMSGMLQTYENNQKQFFQNASHEMRTPLMSIQGYAEGILEDIFDKDEAAGVILSEGQKMTDLVSELLYVSRMDSERTEDVAYGAINVGGMGLLYECCERVKPIAQKFDKQVVIESRLQDVLVAADEEKLERAILNVLSNAIRYADSVVTVNYGVTDEMLEIVIADDGAGIAVDDLPRIFERFYKGDDGNVGLGLAISKDIVKGFGGRIKAENGIDGGAVFTVSLPVVGD